MTQQPFPEFVATLAHRDDPLGDFARDFAADGTLTDRSPSWERLEAHLRGFGAIPDAIAAAQTTWELWSGVPAVEDDEYDDYDEPELSDEDEWLTAEEFDDHLEDLANLGEPRDPYADVADPMD